MRKIAFLSALGLLMLTLLIGCECCPLDPNCQEKLTQNISSLPLDTWVNGEVGSDGVTWYTFKISKPGEVVAQLVLGANQCTYIDIYDTDQTTKVTSRATCSEGEAYKAEARANLDAGQFYIKIKGTSGTPYRIRVKNVAVRWAVDKEPNDSDSEAIAISPNKWITGAIGFYASGHTDSEDWYAVKVNSPSRIAPIMYIDRDSCIYIYLYDRNGVDYLKVDATCSESYPASFTYYISKTGTYYLVIKPSTSGYAAGYKFKYKLLR